MSRPGRVPPRPPADAASERSRIIAEAKSELRTALRQRRDTRTAKERTRADEARFDALTALFEPALLAERLGCVAVYLSRATEPDTHRIVAWLAAHDVTTLLPVIPRAVSGAPAWATYRGPDHLRTGRYGIVEPTGRPLGAASLAAADVIVCPALAVTARGVRLGQGAGWYDRALDHARPDAVLIALVDDDEVLTTLPYAPHDHPMDLVITQTRQIACAAER